MNNESHLANMIPYKFFRQQMERWYNELMKPLRRKGWTEEEGESNGYERRCATNPEGLQRPTGLSRERRQYGSAYGALQGGFRSTQDKRKAIYEIPKELYQVSCVT